MLKFIPKILLIGALAIPFLWLGFNYGGPMKPAYGEIFRELSGPLLLRELRLGAEASRNSWRRLRVNNNGLAYKVGKGEGSIQALFTALETSTEAPEPSARKTSGEPAGREEAAPELPPIRLFRHEWDNWGALGFLLESAPQVQRQQVAPKSEIPGPIMAIVAYLNPDGKSTTYLTFLFDESFDYGALLPADGDAPGRDAPGIPRYPGLKRTYTFEEIGDSFESVMAVYQGNGNYHAVAEYYRSLMPARGWESRDLTVPGVRKKSERALFFARGGAECAVYTASHKPGEVQAIISVRYAKPEG